MKSFGFAVAGRARAGVRLPLVLVVAGTRPEVIKIASLVKAFSGSDAVAVRVVNSGQHAVAVRNTLGEFGLMADIELAPLPPLPNLMAAFGHLCDELAEVIARWSPSSVIVQGDTLTAWAAAVAADRGGFPVAHVEAGLRTPCVSDPFPEEWFRRRIARVASWHFAPTADAARNLLDEGIDSATVFRTGNTGIDSLKHTLASLEPLRDDEPRGAETVLVTLHRRENHDRNADVVCRALIRLAAKRPGLRITLPVHPNPRVAGPIRRRLGGHPAVNLVAPMAYRQFIAVAADASLIVSDSGGIQEEAAHLGTPLLVPRSNTERPEAIATGFVRLVQVDEDTLVAAACAALDAPRRRRLPIDAAAPFGAGDAGLRIVRIVTRLVAAAPAYA